MGEELYKELERIKIIERIKEVPQLGVIKVNNKLSKSRYDYVILQLYFHQIIKKEIQRHLKLTYNNYLQGSEFLSGNSCIESNDKVTIADVIQILCIVYNIGHFYNTFTASRAIIMIAENDDDFIKIFNSTIEDKRFQCASKRIFSECDYHRMHLLNSLIVLEQCNSEVKAVKLAKEIIYAYINENKLESMSKLHYVFRLFRIVRNVAYVAYDLQIADTPFTLDIWNEKAICNFFKELLSEFNNRETANNLIKSVQKLLDDTVYNDSENVICYYQISKRIYRKMIKDNRSNMKDFYKDYWLDKDSIFNKKYAQKHDYVREGILKLTFDKEQQLIAKELFIELDRLENVRVGYYDRYSGKMTIVVSINKSCKDKKKVAFRLFKVVIRFLRIMDYIKPNDLRYLLATKFLLRYIFDENPIMIKSTIDNGKCLFCIKGKKRRISTLQLLLKNTDSSEDDQHEIQAMIDLLMKDTINDVTITIPASTLVYNKNSNKNLCEFDGIIIYPNRKNKQVILIEAKNTEGRPAYGRKCLHKKLKQLNIEHQLEDIMIIGHDAYYEKDIHI